MYSRTQENIFQTCAIGNGFYVPATNAELNAILVPAFFVSPANYPTPGNPQSVIVNGPNATAGVLDAAGLFVAIAFGPQTLAVTATGGNNPLGTGPMFPTGTNIATYDDINRALLAVGVDILYDVSPPGAFPTTIADLINNYPAPYCNATFQSCCPILEALTIEAHGIPLYRDIPADFFNHYVPYTYGGQHINTPVDCGVQMITFNLYPGSYQPSGHVNISRAREFYIDFTRTQVWNGTSYVDDTSTAD
jgi:hypothetical protein